jgi:hypothetical protein
VQKYQCIRARLLRGNNGDEFGQRGSIFGRPILLNSAQRGQERERHLEVKGIGSDATAKKFFGLADSITDGVGMD